MTCEDKIITQLCQFISTWAEWEGVYGDTYCCEADFTEALEYLEEKQLLTSSLRADLDRLKNYRKPPVESPFD